MRRFLADCGVAVSILAAGHAYNVPIFPLGKKPSIRTFIYVCDSYGVSSTLKMSTHVIYYSIMKCILYIP